jgi:glutaredoxin
MIIMYSKPGCAHCDAAKKWLTERGWGFEVIDVTVDPDAMKFITGEGHKTVPQFYQDGKLLVSGGYRGLRKRFITPI